MRRLGDAIVSSATRTASAGAAAGAVTRAAGAGSGPWRCGRTLGGHHSLARSFTRGDLRNRGNHDPRVGRFDRGRLAPDVRRRRAALFLPRFGLRPLLRRRRRWRGRRSFEIEHSKDAFRARQFGFSIEVQEDEEKSDMERDHRRDGSAPIPIADVRSVSHALSTRVAGRALRARKSAGPRGLARRQFGIRIVSAARAALAATPVARLSALARNFALFCGIHRRKSALRSNAPRRCHLCFSRVADWRPCNANKIGPVHNADGS